MDRSEVFVEKAFRNEFNQLGQPQLAVGKYGCRKVRVYLAEFSKQLGRDDDPSVNGSSKSLLLKSFSGKRTLWGPSLPVALALWDMPVLCMPPLPLS